MTIIPPDMQGQLLPRHWLGFEGVLHVVGVARNDQVVTALVDLGQLPLPMKVVGLPHVTVAINPDTEGEAVMSNDFVLDDFERVEPVAIWGKIEELERE